MTEIGNGRGTKMGMKIIKAAITAFLTLTAASAHASGDMIVSPDMYMEASSMCAGGYCNTEDAALEISGLSEIKDLVKKVNVFYEDDRVAQNQSEVRHLAPIGQVEGAWTESHPQTGKQGRPLSTAFLVSPCLVLTNYHAVVKPGTVPNLDEDTVIFRVGKKATGSGFKHEAIATIVTTGSNGSSVGHDWALLYLEGNCLGKNPDIGWMELAPVSISTKNANSIERLMMAGYPGDKGTGQIWKDPNCSLRERLPQAGVWYHDCASRPGASGAPIYKVDAAGVPYVVALNSGTTKSYTDIQKRYIGAGRADSNANYAVDIEIVAGQVQNMIAWDKSSWDGENPQIAMAREEGKPKVQRVKHTIEVKEPKEPRRYSI